LISKTVKLSNDTIIGNGCKIAEEVVFDTKVNLNNNIKVGKRSFLSNIRVNDDSIIEAEVVCAGTKKGNIKIGKNTYIGLRNILDNSDNITIGDFVQLAGSSTALWTHSGAPMVLNSIPLSEIVNTKFRPTAPIVIESNVYIGGNCTIYPGVKIGHHAVVAPNSAVTKDVEPYTMVGGVPARKIKDIEI